MSQQEPETVWISRFHFSSHEKIYHTNRECRNLQRSEKIRGTELHKLSNDMRECELCKNSEEPHGIQQDRKCPFCGEMVGKLPVHLPKCPDT